MGSIIETSGRTFTMKDEPVENYRSLKVRVIGAGFSGVYLGVRIPQRLRNVDLAIYEKNDGLGGTWWENRYPGCACDIPAHSYQYSFEPNKKWSGFYAKSQEIRDYIQFVADKYGVPRFVKLQHEVTNCVWNEAKKKWHVFVKQVDTGETFEENDVDVVVAARGNLNEMSWPDISGIDSFRGEKMHSAAWNDDYDFKNKRIGVIGGGSSSIQIVPELQKIPGAQLSCFVRSKVWISNRFGDHVMEQLGWDPKELNFSEDVLQDLAKSEASYLKFRKQIEDDGNFVHSSSLTGSEMQEAFLEMFTRITKEKLAKKPELLKSFSPAFGVGCRRLTPGPGYLEALVQDNVDFITEPIASVSEDGMILESGRQVDVDVLVCATGFNTTSIPPFPVVGRRGRTLEQTFSPYPQTYLSMAVDGFPNYFMMLGPNSGIGAGSLTPLLEAEGDYILKCIRKLQKEDYASMEPKSARVRDFSDYVGQYFKKTVYSGDCKSWYKTEGGRGDRVSALWPGSILHAMETFRAPRWEDFEYETMEDNMLRWLGNGWSVCLMGGGDPSFYLNPDVVDVPPSGTPEADEKYRIRPFSH